MKKVSILTDSIACLTPELIERYQIGVVPINIHYDGTLYRDGVDMDTRQAYRLLEKSPDYFASSAPSAGEYLKAYREAAAGAESILCITISSRLSTVYEMANVARKNAGSELGHTRVEVMDSGTAAVGEGLVVTAAAGAAAEGRPLEEVIRTASAVRERVHVAGVLETVRYVHRTGRVPEITAKVGSMLNIKPVFTITGGVVRVGRLARRRETALAKALEIMQKEVDGRPVHVAVAHADVPEEGETLMREISGQFDCRELWLADFSPVMAYATGAGVLAIGFYAAE